MGSNFILMKKFYYPDIIEYIFVEFLEFDGSIFVDQVLFMMFQLLFHGEVGRGPDVFDLESVVVHARDNGDEERLVQIGEDVEGEHEDHDLEGGVEEEEVGVDLEEGGAYVVATR